MIIKRLLQKEFTTTQQVAKELSKTFNETVEHILILRYDVDKLSENHHKGEVINGFLSSIINLIETEKSITGEKVIETMYRRKLVMDDKKLAKKIQKTLRNEYNYLRIVSEEDIQFAVRVIETLIDFKDTDKAKNYFYNSDEWKQL